jgi:mRNA interferase RelE/StbE
VTVRWTTRAEKDGDRIDRRTRERIVAALTRFDVARHGDVKKLQGVGGEYRLRVGDWRVRFALVEGGAVVVVLRVLPRGEAYR